MLVDWKNLESIFFGRKRKTFRENFFLIPFFIFIIVEKIRTDLETMENERFQNFSNFHFYPSLSIFLNDLDDNARSLDDNFPRIFIVFARVSSFPSPLPPPPPPRHVVIVNAWKMDISVYYRFIIIPLIFLSWCYFFFPRDTSLARETNDSRTGAEVNLLVDGVDSISSILRM